MKKYKFFATALCALGINPLLYAGAMCCSEIDAGSFKGVYMGVGVGYDQTKEHFHYEQLSINGNTYYNDLYSTQDMATYHGLIGNSNLYGMFYLGEEISLGTFAKTVSNLTTNVSASGIVSNQLLLSKQNLDVTASILAGVNVYPTTLIYGQAGFGAGRFNVQTFDTNPTVVPTYVSKSIWVPEWLVGIGVEQMVAESISLRLSYQYEQSETFTGPVSGTANFPAGTYYHLQEHTYNSRNNVVMLDAIWRIASL